MLDLDFFKTFNDTHGHDAGDVLLRLTGELLQSTFRGSDISCRYGGEEFIVVLMNSDICSAELRLEDFRQAVKNEKIVFKVTHSFSHCFHWYCRTVTRTYKRHYSRSRYGSLFCQASQQRQIERAGEN